MNIKALQHYPWFRLSGPAEWTAATLSVTARWRELARQRRDLAGLEEYLLRDIGVDRIDAIREARRPFWDDPLA